MNLPEVFLSPGTFRTAFEKGLDRQLQQDSLGTFILVLANALFDEHIFVKLKDRLQEKYEQNKQDYAYKLQQGKYLNDAPDDMLVFLKLIAMGFDNLKTTVYRHTDNWELQFNQLRSLRPQRMSGATISRLMQEYNDNAFHFNKPFLNKEVFWSGNVDGVPVKLLYNKFPFATLHGLLVPEPADKLPQFLNADMHHFASSLCHQLGKNIPDIAIAYNGNGAGASINHLHFQTFTMKQPLPVLDSQWQHNGGNTPYPAHCKVFESAVGAWHYINELHQHNITYNLVYLPDVIICLPRPFQGSYEIPQWTENFAWYELCGGVTTFNQNDFQGLGDEEISAALSTLHLDIP
mgnify:FL=1